MRVEIIFYNYFKKCLDSLRFYYNNKDFKIVYNFMLLKISYNLTRIISLDIVINILFAFKSSFCYQNMLIYRELNKLLSFIGIKHIIFVCIVSFYFLTLLLCIASFKLSLSSINCFFLHIIQTNSQIA